MSDSIQPAVLERPRKLTELSQLTFEVIAGDYSRAGNQPANYTLVKGRREALLVDVPFGRADAHRLIARILDTGLKLHRIFITHSRPDHVSSLDLLIDVFPDAAVFAHSAVAADIKRLIPLNSDRRAEGIGDNATRRSIIPAALCTDHIRLEGHKLEILGPVQQWTRRYINDFRTFLKMAKSAAEMTDMLRVRDPNAIGFPAPDGVFEISTEVATGEIALVG